MRGAVSGLGVVNLLMGFDELASVLWARRTLQTDDGDDQAVMICLVTDRRRLSSGHDAADRLVDLVAAAARAGVDLIQVRERDLEARDLTALVRAVRRRRPRTRARRCS